MKSYSSYIKKQSLFNNTIAFILINILTTPSILNATITPTYNSESGIFLFAINPSNFNMITQQDKNIFYPDLANYNLDLNWFIEKIGENNSYKDRESTVILEFAGGIYKFSDLKYLSLSGEKNGKKISLVLRPKDGEKVYIISDGNEYDVANKASYSENSTHYIFPINSNTPYYRGETYVDQYFNPILLWDSGDMDKNTKMNRAINEIKVGDLDKSKYILKMDIGKDLADKLGRSTDINTYNNLVYWTSTYEIMYGRIEKIIENTLYFKTNSSLEPQAGINGYIEANRDKWLTDAPPLFYVTNTGKDNSGKIYVQNNNIYIPKDKDIKKVYECKYSRFIDFGNTKLKSIKIENLNFVGSALFDQPTTDFIDHIEMSISNEHKNNSMYGFKKKKSLIYLQETDNVEINNNYFKNIGSHAVIELTPYMKNDIARHKKYNYGCHIYDNIAEGNYGSFINANIIESQIEGNVIRNSGIFYKNDGVINIQAGINFSINNNTIINFPYSAIAIRQWGSEDYIKGKVEYNEAFCDEDYNANYNRNMLMDGGPIYFWTQNDISSDKIDITCQYNIVHNFKGKMAMRGIYLDNGIFNVKLIGNLVYNMYYKNFEFHDHKNYTIFSYLIGTSDNLRNSNNLLEKNILLEPFEFRSKGESTKKVNYYGGCWDYSLNLLNEEKLYKQFLPDIIDLAAKVDKDQIILYEDISSFNLPSFITDRIVQCEVLKLDKTPQFNISSNFMRLSTSALNGYENSSYNIQNNHISPNSIITNGWITSYKLKEDIKITLNDEFQFIDAKFAIIGTPAKQSDLSDIYYPTILKISDKNTSVMRSIQAINPISSGINNMIYIKEKNLFRTEYIPMNQLKGIVIETLATSSIKLGVEVICLSKKNQHIMTVKKEFPITKIEIKPTQKYLIIGKEQANFSLSNYWASPGNLYLTSQSSSVHIGRNIIMEDGFVGQDGFVAKASYTINEIGNTNINFIKDCQGNNINKAPLKPNLFIAEALPSIISDFKIESKINLYSNPTKGIFQIQGLDSNMKYNIDIYDISGQNVYSNKNFKNSDRIDLRGKPRGVYMARIIINRQIIAKKLILK